MDQNRDLGKSGPAFAQGFTMTALVSTALSGCEPLEVPLSDSRRHAMVLLDGGAFTASTLSHDALATALMVLGPQDGYNLAEKQGWAVLLVIRKDDGFEEKATPAFQRILNGETESR